MDKTFVLYEGYSHCNLSENKMLANCTCTLVKAQKNIIVDTMTAWDSNKILDGLQKYKVTPNQIDYVVSTHGHSDHIGNNNLFLMSKHIVGFNISHQNTYYLHPFDKGLEYKICDDVDVIPTPGHTLSDVTVRVAGDFDIVGITGDLFECYEDIDDPNIWLEAGSEDPIKQRQNRLKIANLVNWIIPGHGAPFEVTDAITDKLKRQVDEKVE